MNFVKINSANHIRGTIESSRRQINFASRRYFFGIGKRHIENRKFFIRRRLRFDIGLFEKFGR